MPNDPLEHCPDIVITKLREEVARLKAGQFTSEELQNLCHTFSEKDKCAFFEGCHKYQQSLFGESDRQNFTVTIQALRNVLKHILGRGHFSGSAVTKTNEILELTKQYE